MGEAKPGDFCSFASGQHSLSLAAEGSLGVASISESAVCTHFLCAVIS